MIENVDYSTAQLLKENGFDEPCTHHLIDDKSIINFGSRRISKDILEDLDEGTKLLAIPTIADIVMWLYEKHGIWIYVRFADDYKIFFYDIIDTKNLKATTSKSVNHFNSPTEAYLEAIKYVLQHLIK